MRLRCCAAGRDSCLTHAAGARTPVSHADALLPPLPSKATTAAAETERAIEGGEAPPRRQGAAEAADGISRGGGSALGALEGAEVGAKLSRRRRELVVTVTTGPL